MGIDEDPMEAAGESATTNRQHFHSVINTELSDTRLFLSYSSPLVILKIFLFRIFALISRWMTRKA